jgi:hypothetical protein
MNIIAGAAASLLIAWAVAPPGVEAGQGLDYRVSWVGNSFPGTEGQWVQNFFIHANARPDGSVITWSHWDEGGLRFGVYKDGRVVANRDEHANSLEARNASGRTWRIVVKYVDPRNNEYDFQPEGKPGSPPTSGRTASTWSSSRKITRPRPSSTAGGLDPSRGRGSQKQRQRRSLGSFHDPGASPTLPVQAMTRSPLVRTRAPCSLR